MSNFRELKVWGKAHYLTLRIYECSKLFPKEELYGLTSQIRRAASSIPANIAEGCGRNGDTEFARFLQIALGSATEVEYHLILAKDLNYLNAEIHKTLENDLIEIKKMLVVFIQKLRGNNN